jgi:hypothetical protein
MQPPQDMMSEMYDFLAFDQALEDGLDVDSLIQEQAAQGRAQLEIRMHHLISQLHEFIQANEQERESLMREARNLAPREAQVYCNQLTERIHELKQTEAKQKQAYGSVEKEAREQCAQNALLVGSLATMRSLNQQNQKHHSHLQRELYKAGDILCQHISYSQQE